jgi:transcriptional regulator with XRE-family HTH domain
MLKTTTKLAHSTTNLAKRFNLYTFTYRFINNTIYSLFMYDIHRKIIAIRKMRKFSQQQAAKLVNIPFRTYQRIEAGETSTNTDYLNRLAEGFHCSINDILHFDLENNQFPVERISALTEKNQALEEENGRLRQFVNWLTEQLHINGEESIK